MSSSKPAASASGRKRGAQSGHKGSKRMFAGSVDLHANRQNSQPTRTLIQRKAQSTPPSIL